MLSQTEENYLKAIFKLEEKSKKNISTNAIAGMLKTTAASVTDMVKRLAEKQFVNYKKYKGVTLTPLGTSTATGLIRKHRLWEVFLYKELKFNWDQVHEIAEQLEHIKSEQLTDKLEEYLSFPTHDPHGDPIPDREGNIRYHEELMLSDLNVGEKCRVIGVKDSSTEFLQFLDKSNLKLGSNILVSEKYSYDGSVKIVLDKKDQQTLSNLVSKNLYVVKK